MIFDLTQSDGIERMAKSMMCLIPDCSAPDTNMGGNLVPYLTKKGFVFILVGSLSVQKSILEWNSLVHLLRAWKKEITSKRRSHSPVEMMIFWDQKAMWDSIRDIYQ